MYLYEIPQAYKTILDNADPETGEILFDEEKVCRCS